MNATEAGLRFPKPVSANFAPHHKWDHNFFLLWTALIWLGIVMGFGPEIAQHFQTHAKPYPIIIHIHAAAFVSWLILLTAQVLLIRGRRLRLHRKLGQIGAGLAVAMIIIGPITALMVHRLEFGAPGDDPAFLSVQFADILAFAGLVGPAFLLTRQPATHKRLILLATLFISDAGFARWLGPPLSASLGTSSLWALMATLYLGNDILVFGLGLYDWITRHRLHPAYVVGVAWTAVLQLTAASLLTSTAWKPIALRLLGH